MTTELLGAAAADTARATPVRLAVFTTHPIQYQAPLFRELARRPELDLTVFFGSRHGLDVSFDEGFGQQIQWDTPLLEGYRSVFLTNTARVPNVSEFNGVQVPGVAKAWTRDRFDAALVLGWGTAGHLQAMRAATKAHIPLMIRGESNLVMQPSAPFKAWMRRLIWLPMRQRIYRWMFSHAEAFLVIGTRNVEFYRFFGVEQRKMFWAPYAVDNTQFALPEPERTDARARRRAELGASDDTVVFASSAKLLARKRPLDLLFAFARLIGAGVKAHLLFIGDGPERARLEEAIAAAKLESRVTITGFVNQRAIPEYYAAADCLVLPSDAMETWGLAVNEGMAAGLPVIVSDAVGCAPDLVRDGENGWTFSYANVPELADRMRKIADLTPEQRAAMGNRSREIIDGCSIPRVADAIVTASRHAAGVRA